MSVESDYLNGKKDFVSKLYASLTLAIQRVTGLYYLPPLILVDDETGLAPIQETIQADSLHPVRVTYSDILGYRKSIQDINGSISNELAILMGLADMGVFAYAQNGYITFDQAEYIADYVNRLFINGLGRDNSGMAEV